MSQPVKLSDPLVLDARVAGEASERSIAGQVQFWASLGRAIEPLLRGDTLLALVRSGGERSLSQCLGEVDTPTGRRRVKEFLHSGPYPHYEPLSRGGGLLVRTEVDGTRTVGRFVNRRFVPVKAKARK